MFGFPLLRDWSEELNHFLKQSDSDNFLFLFWVLIGSLLYSPFIWLVIVITLISLYDPQSNCAPFDITCVYKSFSIYHFFAFSFLKISAFIMCGKLKSAYLIAVQGNRVDAIREIADVAEKSGQSKMVEICCKFLTQYEKQRAATERRTAVQRKHGAESNR